MERWIGRLSPGNGKLSRNAFYRWMAWLKVRGGRFGLFSPDDLVEFQKQPQGDDEYAILDLLEDYVKEKPGRESSKQRWFSDVKSFFMHNRAALPVDRSFTIRSEREKSVGTLTLEEFKRLLNACNPMYRALFLCMFQGGLGIGEALYWSKKGLDIVRRDLGAGICPMRIALPGRKKTKNVKPYYTFIGSDGVEALGYWMSRRRPGPGDIFITNAGTPINYFSVWAYWMRQLKRLGFVKRIPGEHGGQRYGKNMHELRDLFRTRWEKSGRSSAAAEFFMGHSVDPLEYNKALQDEDYGRMEYRHAQDWLNILSQDPEKVPRDSVEEVREKLEARVKELERANERVRRLDMLLEDPEVSEAFVKMLRELKEKQR